MRLVDRAISHFIRALRIRHRHRLDAQPFQTIHASHIHRRPLRIALHHRPQRLPGAVLQEKSPVIRRQIRLEPAHLDRTQLGLQLIAAQPERPGRGCVLRVPQHRLHIRCGNPWKWVGCRQFAQLKMPGVAKQHVLLR
ncbi:hypothetical protein SDC9_129418 [bioreactor metagenome]|uniref:Uncharacterized protein n=1 Tax=bioreactor metagenome TaxID=1076179 RepID=A0A645CZK0_9ZZZZ